MVSLSTIIILGSFILLAVSLLAFGVYSLFTKVGERQQVLLAIAVILCVIFIVGWRVPIGTLTGTWQLTSDFRANPRHVQPAPTTIRFFNDGTGTKIDHEGYEREFEWHWRTIGYSRELAMNTRWGSYIVRFRGFGTRLTIEDSLRGERTMGRFDTRRDFRANFRRSFRN